MLLKWLHPVSLSTITVSFEKRKFLLSYRIYNWWMDWPKHCVNSINFMKKRFNCPNNTQNISKLQTKQKNMLIKTWNASQSSSNMQNVNFKFFYSNHLKQSEPIQKYMLITFTQNLEQIINHFKFALLLSNKLTSSVNNKITMNKNVNRF